MNENLDNMKDKINNIKNDIKTLEDALKLIDKSATSTRYTISNHIGLLENELDKLVKENKLKEDKIIINIARTNKIRDLVKDTLYNMCESGSSFNNTTYANVKKIAGLINDFDTTNPICEVTPLHTLNIGDSLYINGKVRTILNMLDNTDTCGKHTNTTLTFDYGIKVDCNRGSTVARVLRGDNNE